MNETGKDLDILISTSTSDDWRTFGTWYSVYKNLPEARVSFVCNRNNKIEFQYFQWIKRMNLKHLYLNSFSDDPYANMLQNVRAAQSKGFVGDTVLVITPEIMVVDSFDNNTLIRFAETIILNDYAMYLNELYPKDVAKLLDDYILTGEKPIEIDDRPLYHEAKDSEIGTCLTSYKKGCGKWIDTLRGCPFSNAGGLISETMSVNETRIIELWRKMVPLYSAVL